MVSATLSSQFQLAIPQAMCDELGIFAGQKFALIAKWAKHNMGEALGLEAVALTEQGRVVPLNTSLALYAA